MQQQLSRPAWRVAEAVGGAVFGNVGVDEEQLAAGLVGIGLVDAGLALTQHLYLTALQDQPRLEFLLDQIIVARAPVLRGVAIAGAHRSLPVIDGLSQLSRPAPRIAPCTFSWVAGVVSHSGRRTSAVQRPSSEAAYLTGAGLVSTKSASCNGINRSLMRRTVATSPFCHAVCISDSSAGATLAVTEMQPSPLCARKPTAVPSSPDSIENSSPTSTRNLVTRDRSLVESLTPMMFGSFASRANVAFDMSTAVRPGML